MASIANMLDLITNLENNFIEVHQERCVLVRNRNASCLRCAEMCTSECISFDGEQLTLFPERCIGCGTCATACPTCALEAHHPDDARLMRSCEASAEANAGVVCIACGQLLDRAQGLYDTEKVVRVECLGRVEESLLTTLVAHGATEVALVHGACESCEHATGRRMVEQVCETERMLLDTWKSPATVRLTSKLPTQVHRSKHAYDQEKRAAFEQSRQSATQAALAATSLTLTDALESTGASAPHQTIPVTKVMSDGTLPHFLPDRRERLLDALASLGSPRDEMIETRLWGHVVIDIDACTSCQMCATFCPTGALSKFQDDDGTFGVEHYPGDCVKCRCCTNICPANALSLSESVFAVDMLAGMTDRYAMKPLAVKRGTAHTIWNMMKTMTGTDQIYER